MDRIPKPSNDNPFEGFINMCRDLDDNPRIKVEKITMWEWKITVSSWWWTIWWYWWAGCGTWKVTVVSGEWKLVHT